MATDFYYPTCGASDIFEITQQNNNYTWQVGAWGTCTNNVQTRSVSCQNDLGNTMSDSYCTATKPATVQSCTSYTYSWTTGNWGTCTDGQQTRTVLCQRSDGTMVSNLYCSVTRPVTVQSCTKTLAWVATDGTQSCDSVCAQANNSWVVDAESQGCASGERVPTWGTFNYLFGTILNPSIGGYYLWSNN